VKHPPTKANGPLATLALFSIAKNGEVTKMRLYVLDSIKCGIQLNSVRTCEVDGQTPGSLRMVGLGFERTPEFQNALSREFLVE